MKYIPFLKRHANQDLSIKLFHCHEGDGWGGLEVVEALKRVGEAIKASQFNDDYYRAKRRREI